MLNNSEISRSKRYSSTRQRSTLNENLQTPPQYHSHLQQQELEANVALQQQQQQTSVPAQSQQQVQPQHIQNVLTNPSQAQQAPVPQQNPQKYQPSAYYASNANDYAQSMAHQYQYMTQSVQLPTGA